MFSFFACFKYQYGDQKTQDFMQISNLVMSVFKNVPKEVKSKMPWKNVKILKIRLVFLAIAFFRGICFKGQS